MQAELRPHQVQALTNLKRSILAGHFRPVVQAPTGAGKTILAAAIVEGAQAKGNRVVFCVPAIALIDQTVRAFYAQGIDDIGVIQASHPMTDASKSVQVASVQTLERRNLPAAGVVIVDECHRKAEVVTRWMRQPDMARVPFIGLSATPWRKGMGKEWDDLIVAATTADLIEAGYLCRFRVFAPSHPDLSGVKIVAGDYHEGQLSEAMNKPALVADVVTTWLERAERRPTLVFAVDRAHAAHLAERFQAAGVKAGYQDALTDAVERETIRRQFHSGDLEVVCNVGTLCLDAETEILTDTGWVGIDAMTYQHRVAAWAEAGVEFTEPLHIVRRDREPHEKMVSVEGRVHNIRVTANHRMLWSKSPSGFKITPAAEIVGLSGFIPVSGNAVPKVFEREPADANRDRLRRNGLTHKYRKKFGMTAEQAEVAAAAHRQHLALNCAPKMPHELSIDECQFIGFWIGDGTRSGGRFSVAQSKRYPKIIQWFDDLVARIGLNVTRSVYPPAKKSTHESIRWNFSTGRGGRGQRVDGGLAPIMPFLEKDGTDLLWGLNAEQFEALLHGYWLADGNHGSDGAGEGAGKRISGCSIALFELLQAIGACRGIRIAISRENSKHRKVPFYRITWLRQSASRLVRERLQLEDDFRAERVWCVTSTTGNIITRRKGKVAVVGNTTGVDWDVRCIVMARPTRSEMLFVQCIGRGLRTAPGKADCLARDTLVLTDRGEVKIQDVTLDHKVWDGVNFVAHAGAICRGVRPVISHDGITATPDHKVMTDAGWKTLAEAHRGGLRITRSGLGGIPLRVADDCVAQDRGQQLRPQGGGAVRAVWQEAHGTLPQHSEAAGYASMPALQRAQAGDGSAVALSALPGAARSLPQPVIDLLPVVRSQGDRVSLCEPQRGGALDRGESWCGGSVDGNRPHRQRRPLRAGQPALGAPGAEHREQQEIDWSEGSFHRLPRAVSRGEVCGRDAEAIDPLRTVGQRDRGAVEGPIVQAEREVWDILNAGPIQRFTANGRLVHNCLILDHSDTHLRLGLVTDIHHERLDDGKGAQKGDAERRKPMPKECTSCSYLKPAGIRKCPNCGFEPVRQDTSEDVEGELVELGKKRMEATMADKRRWFGALSLIGMERGYKPGWAANQYREKFGVWPRGMDGVPPVDDPAVRSWVTSRLIRYAKRRKAEQHEAAA